MSDDGDIELEIGAGPTPGHYDVRVLRAAAGGEPVGTLKLDVNTILSQRELLEATVLASAVAHRAVPLAERPVRQLGQQIFEALFTGPVYGMYRASLVAARQRGGELRVVLRLTAPELAAVPWEMLFDPETGTYLCRQEPLVRHVHAPYTAEPLEVRLPLRILGLIASPRGLPQLDVEAEQSHLAGALAQPIAKGLVELSWADEASWPQVHARLLDGPWHVLHFVGHGGYDAAADEGFIALRGANGRADHIEASRLADLLSAAQPTPRLVVLNSCSSGQAGVNDLFSSTAATLARRGISAVAAMQFAISDAAAIAFARGFYSALASGRGVDEAARSGRISILGAPRSLEWVTPVLYLRGQSSQLFTLAAPPGPEPEPPSTSEPSPDPYRLRQAQLQALYVAARAELRLEDFDAAIGLFDDLLTLDPDYPDAVSQRAVAQRGKQLAEAYALAAETQEAGDWGTAARRYGDVLQIDPAYRDAADRKAVCELEQQASDLRSELRHHAERGQWQAVLDVDAELSRLVPALADPDGLATRAGEALEAERRAADLERRYDLARAAEDRREWSGADRAYSKIMKIDPGYRDVQARRESCRRHSRIESLKAEIEVQARAGNWWHVLADIEKLTELDPVAVTEPSRAELAELARRKIAARPSEPLQSITLDYCVNALSWHPDGRRIACAIDHNSAKFFDVSREKPTRKLTVRYGVSYLGIRGIAFCPDGTRLATGGEDSTARIWDASTGKQLLKLRHPGWVRAVAFSPDGARLATGGDDDDGIYDSTARIWDASTGKQLLKLRHSGGVNAVAFSPDGTRLATGSNSGTARIWDTDTGERLIQVRHDDSVNAVAFSPDGTRLATGSGEGTARIWPVGL